MIGRRTYIQAARLAVIAGISAVFLIPFAWMVVSSLKDPTKVFELPINWFPEVLRFDNYSKLFTHYEFQKYIWSTLRLCLLNMLGLLVSCTLVAYGFSFGRWRHKNKLFMLVLATMMLPGTVVFFPQFILFVRMHWYGTLLPLWVPSFFGSAYYIFFLRQYFLLTPPDLVKAARIDGCNDLQILLNVVLPMAKPVIIVMLMNTFISVWGDFFNQLIYITRNDQQTVMIGLTMLNSSYGSTSNSTLPAIMAGSLVVSLPVLLVYYFGQKTMMSAYVFREAEK